MIIAFVTVSLVLAGFLFSIWKTTSWENVLMKYALLLQCMWAFFILTKILDPHLWAIPATMQ